MVIQSHFTFFSVCTWFVKVKAKTKGNVMLLLMFTLTKIEWKLPHFRRYTWIILFQCFWINQTWLMIDSVSLDLKCIISNIRRITFIILLKYFCCWCCPKDEWPLYMYCNYCLCVHILLQWHILCKTNCLSLVQFRPMQEKVWFRSSALVKRLESNNTCVYKTGSFLQY